MKCDQLKCAYNMFGGCQSCDECGAEPNVLDENCDRCLGCARRENELRWDIFKPKKEEEKEVERLENKPMEIIIK